MVRNEGNTDRAVRGVLAVVALVLAGVVGFDSVGGIVLAVVGVVMAVTGAVGVCPLYKVVGMSTCPIDTSKS